MPPEMEETIRKSTPIMKEAQQQKLKANINRGILYVDGKKYTVNDLVNYPHTYL